MTCRTAGNDFPVAKPRFQVESSRLTASPVARTVLRTRGISLATPPSSPSSRGPQRSRSRSRMRGRPGPQMLGQLNSHSMLPAPQRSHVRYLEVRRGWSARPFFRHFRGNSCLRYCLLLVRSRSSPRRRATDVIQTQLRRVDVWTALIRRWFAFDVGMGLYSAGKGTFELDGLLATQRCRARTTRSSGFTLGRLISDFTMRSRSRPSAGAPGHPSPRRVRALRRTRTPTALSGLIHRPRPRCCKTCIRKHQRLRTAGWSIGCVTGDFSLSPYPGTLCVVLLLSVQDDSFLLVRRARTDAFRWVNRPRAVPPPHCSWLALGAGARRTARRAPQLVCDADRLISPDLPESFRQGVCARVLCDPHRAGYVPVDQSACTGISAWDIGAATTCWLCYNLGFLWLRMSMMSGKILDSSATRPWQI